VFLCFVFVTAWPVVAQEAAPPPAEKPAEKAPPKQAESKDVKGEKVELPFQIQLLETHVRFETNGDSRKEVHTIVKINNILGAREFSRLTFDYNRAWQQVEIPLVRVSHANGGTSELLPSAVTDAPNPAVEKFPAYQDVRVKSARILGLQEGDTIEYRVITTSTKPPLAPDFWLEHTFDRLGQVLEEHYDLDLPVPRRPEIRINPTTPATSQEASSSGENARQVYRWTRKFSPASNGSRSEESTSDLPTTPDISLSTLGWEFLAIRLDELLLPGSKALAEVHNYEESTKEGARQPVVTDELREKALLLTKDSKTDLDRLLAIYDFVAAQIRSVQIPLGATDFEVHPASEVLKAGYANAEDKYVLFAALATALKLSSRPALTGFCDKQSLAIPTKFQHLVAIVSAAEKTYWLEPSLEVAPFGMISPAPGKCALVLNRGFFFLSSTGHEWVEISHILPFPSKQSVTVEASLSREGTLASTVKYVMRGDNELLLREAFHGTAKEKWKDVAGLLAISDGFRGEIGSVNVSDPMATREPFKVEYTITQAKFVDWSKKPVRIPALLPQIGLPDLPRKAADGNAAPKIELGTPLDVETQMTLKLPAGTKAVVPPGTAVNRDYARFSSKYGTSTGAGGETVTASRRVNFLLQEIDGARGLDYNAFVRAVQNDQAGMIVLEREGAEKK
jgi:hypothetical protein